MASGIKITGKVKWITPDRYTDHYELIWSSPSGRLEKIAEITTTFDRWVLTLPAKYSSQGDEWYYSFMSKREAKAYAERYYGIARKKYSRPKDWHPFGL